MAGVIVDVDAKGHATGFETRLTNAIYFLPVRALLVFVVFLTAFVAVNFFPALIFFVAFIGFDLAFLFGLSDEIRALISDFFTLFLSVFFLGTTVSGVSESISIAKSDPRSSVLRDFPLASVVLSIAVEVTTLRFNYFWQSRVESAI